MNSPNNQPENMPEWKFPDLISHLLASQILANTLSMKMFNGGSATLSDLQPLPTIRPIIPILQPTFTPTTEQWAVIDHVDAGVREIDDIIRRLHAGTHEQEQAELLTRLGTALETLLNF